MFLFLNIGIISHFFLNLQYKRSDIKKTTAYSVPILLLYMYTYNCGLHSNAAGGDTTAAESDYCSLFP